MDSTFAVTIGQVDIGASPDKALDFRDGILSWNPAERVTELLGKVACSH